MTPGSSCPAWMLFPGWEYWGFFSYAGSSSEWFKDKQGRWEQQSNSKGGLDEAWRNLGQWEVSLPKGGGWKETIFNPNNSRIP